jgi:hypothetical protein
MNNIFNTSSIYFSNVFIIKIKDRNAKNCAPYIQRIPLENLEDIKLKNDN